MKNNIETCLYCKRAMMAHRHTFSESLARIMLEAARQYGPGQPFHLQRDFPEWSHNQYSNFQKLRYFGLAEKHRDFVGKHAGGYWHITEKALWLMNAHKVPAWVRTFDNRVIEEAEEQVSLKEAVGYYDIPEKWARRAQPLKACASALQEQFAF